nr:MULTISPECIES: hypothetical protein [unclassified Pseudomonas]
MPHAADSPVLCLQAPGSVLGWGVTRNSPWHFVGVYLTKDAAQAKAADLGGEYKVSYGSHELGTDSFIGGLPQPV